MLGVLDMLRKYPEIMQPLFIQAGPRKKLDKVKDFAGCLKVYNTWPYKIGNINDLLTFYIRYFKSILKPVFLDPLDNRRSAEEATYIFFLDFLDECQGRSFSFTVNIIIIF